MARVKPTYNVRAVRWDGGWELHIDGAGVTQSRTLKDAERMVRSYIALDTGAGPDSFGVEITPDLGGELLTRVDQARRAVAEAEAKQREAATLSRAAAKALIGDGKLSGTDAATVLGVSKQRVSQLVH
jgi:hypothetical protein